MPHVSGLLRRLARSSGAGNRVTEWLFKVAVERGARHFERELDASLPADCPDITDEEIGIALCLGEQPYDLDRLRAAAQLLSSPAVDASRLCRLAVQERCEPVLLHIANLAGRFAPELHPWALVRRHLPPRAVPRTDALPHWSRLVSDENGYVVFESELEAQKEIVDNQMTRLRQFLDGEQEYEDAIAVEEYVVPVSVHPDGVIVDEDGRCFGPKAD